MIDKSEFDKINAELAALREAIKYLVENVDIPTYELEMLGFVDESGKPTKIVTGDAPNETADG